MINRRTKFEVSTFTHYEDMKGNAKCRVLMIWWLGSLKITGNVIIRYSTYDFIFDFNRNYASTLCRSRVIASYLSNIACCNLPCLHLTSPLW